MKYIIFDLGGVLLDIDLAYCMHQVQALGLDLDALAKIPIPQSAADEKPAVMGEGMVATGIMHLYQVGGVSTPDFIGAIQCHCRPGTTYEEALKAWNTCCIGIPQRRLDKVLELRRRRYHTLMLSKTNDAHWQDIKARCFGASNRAESDGTGEGGAYASTERLAVEGYFDRVFLSQEMHLAKPNDAIFEQVLKETGAKAEDCLFIDDSTPNVEAAAKLGFNTLHVEVSKTENGQVVALPSVDWMDAIEEYLR